MYVPTIHYHAYDAANRLLEDDDFTYAWDLNGNMISKTPKCPTPDPCSLTPTRYRYDAENMMTHVDLPDGGTADYSYDPLGRRILKSVTEPAPGASRLATFFLYDNEDILSEFSLTADSWSLTATFLHGPGIDEPLAIMTGSAVEFFHSDALGSITGMTSVSGSSISDYRYSSFGELDADPASVRRYSYTGREGPEETHFYQYRVRSYYPSRGRFTSEDPYNIYVKFRNRMTLESESNLYVYVANSPLTYADPWGLRSYGGGIAGGAAGGVGSGVTCSVSQSRCGCTVTCQFCTLIGLGAGAGVFWAIDSPRCWVCVSFYCFGFGDGIGIGVGPSYPPVSGSCARRCYTLYSRKC